MLMAQPAKQIYTYKVVGDCSIQADVYRASGDSVRPAILWIHGGALIMGNRGGLRFEQLGKYLDAGYTDYQPLRPVSARSGRKEFIDKSEITTYLRGTQSFPRTRRRPDAPYRA
jgi:hypothetical protein